MGGRNMCFFRGNTYFPLPFGYGAEENRLFFEEIAGGCSLFRCLKTRLGKRPNPRHTEAR